MFGFFAYFAVPAYTFYKECFGGVALKKSLTLWQVAGFFFVAASGSFLHFAYDLSGGSALVAPFSAVNESVWEHMKLLFMPSFVFALVQSAFWGDGYENFWCAKLAGITAGLAAIPVLYYTYTGIFGVNADWFNITIFFIAAALATFIETQLLKREEKFCFSPLLAFAILCIIFVSFVLLTFVQPQIPLFRDPVTNSYGIVPQ